MTLLEIGAVCSVFVNIVLALVYFNELGKSKALETDLHIAERERDKWLNLYREAIQKK